MYNALSEFYRSKEWEEFRKVIIAERTAADGFVYDEVTRKPIVKAYDIILHHKIELTLDNVNDANISLNPDNIQIVSFTTHNEIHNRYGSWTRHIYLVYGCPLAGKSTYVKERAGIHDLIVDLDRIRECISNNPPYVKSGRLDDNAFAVRDTLLEQVKFRRGKWVNAWIIAGMPYKGARERFMAEYGAEGIFIDCTQEIAIERLYRAVDRRDKVEWRKYIEKWFNQYQE